jgi:hypothetical protein
MDVAAQRAVHDIIGPGAAELIPEAVLAIELEATLDTLSKTIHAHPSLAEATMEAAMVALGLPIHVPAITAKARDEKQTSGPMPSTDTSWSNER